MNFPAVTVCNLNMMKSSAAITDNKYKELVGLDQYFEYDILRKLQNNANFGSVQLNVVNGALTRKKRSTAKQFASSFPDYGKHSELYSKSTVPILDAKEDAGVAQKENIEQKIVPEHLEVNIKGKDMIDVVPTSVDPGSNQGHAKSRRKTQVNKSSGDYGQYYDWLSWYDDSTGDSDGRMYDYDQNYGEYEDYGFAGNIPDDYAFKEFVKHSRTSDYSDLIDVLKPSREDLDAYGHQASDFILQCSFNKMNCSYV